MSIWDRVALKEMTETNLSMVLFWRNQDFVREMMYSSDIISMEQHLEWFKTLQKQKTSIAQVFYFDEKPYGVVYIHQIDYSNGTCKWSFYIGDKEAPPGFGIVLGYLAICYIFDYLHLRKICAEVLGFNDKSYHFHKKLGFEQEGLLKEQISKGGRYVDVILFGLFESKWSEQSGRIKDKIEKKLKK